MDGSIIGDMEHTITQLAPPYTNQKPM